MPSIEPDGGGGLRQGSCARSIVVYGDCAKLAKFGDEILDQASRLVGRPNIVSQHLAVCFGAVSRRLCKSSPAARGPAHLARKLGYRRRPTICRPRTWLGLGLLIDREVTRDSKWLCRRLNLARLRQNAVLEDAALRSPRGLDPGLLQSLTTCGWIRNSHHVLIGGPTGVSEAGQGSARQRVECQMREVHGWRALGHKACRDGFSVLYRRAPRLFVDLATARGEGRLARLMRGLERTRLLIIIDDWGPGPKNAEQRRDLLEIGQSEVRARGRAGPAPPRDRAVAGRVLRLGW